MATVETHGEPCPKTEDMAKMRIAARSAVQHFEPMLAQFLATIDIVVSKGRLCFTDGKTIFIGYDFCQKLPRGAVFAVYHEMWHMGFNHLARFEAMKGRPKDHALYNVLTDCKINSLAHQYINFSSSEWKKYEDAGLVHAGNIEKILDDELKAGWRAGLGSIKFSETDQAFRALQPYCKEGMDFSKYLLEGDGALGQGVTEEALRDVERRITQSISSAKSRGVGTGSAVEELDEIWGTPHVPWKRIISNSIMSRLKKAKTWQRFHKKTFYIGGRRSS